MLAVAAAASAAAQDGSPSLGRRLRLFLRRLNAKPRVEDSEFWRDLDQDKGQDLGDLVLLSS